MNVFIWKLSASWGTQRRSCLGSHTFSVKTEQNHGSIPPGLLAPVPPFTYVFKKIFI